ncbi:hypothetical protein BOTNAR_0127g00120 [Botryotinia narcissicola]|uniref:Uncharacterized protein n=1 Tax=Botryotinia narcissicola TaxID=278944 RepID=A0A4Z1IJF8_9HELO|nr:hypothetical protein BOTNAR_0127g00120 [Botryotinia narcissicola]
MVMLTTPGSGREGLPLTASDVGVDQRTLRLNGGKSGADQEFQAQGFGTEFSRSVGTTRK